MKKDYTKTMNYAVVSMIDRSTQDDHRSKIQIAGLFENPIVAEDSFLGYFVECSKNGHIHNAGIYPSAHICKTPEQAEKEWDKFNK